MEKKEEILKRKTEHYGTTEAAIHFAMDEFAIKTAVEFATFIRTNRFEFDDGSQSWISPAAKWMKGSNMRTRYSIDELIGLFKHEVDF